MADVTEKAPLLDDKVSLSIDDELPAPASASPVSKRALESRQTQLLYILCFAILLCSSDVFGAPYKLFERAADPYFAAERLAKGATEREQAFLRIPSASSILEASRNYTSHVHVAGTPEGKHSALVVKEQWAQHLGLPITKPTKHVFDAGSHESARFLTAPHGGDRVWTDTYYTLLNYPANTSYIRLFDNQGESVFNATMHEEPLDEDWTSNDAANSPYTPPFHGFSKAGAAEGELVYANYGRYEDFEELKSRGIGVKGKIVIVRYEGNFRGLKVALAARHGAIGVIIYSDPFQDGEITAERGYAAYPHGPARQPSSVQRGSVQKLSLYPGDPLTPGRPAYKNADRLPREEAKSLADIPSLPISYADALPLLQSLEGKGQRIGGEWEGALEDITYWTGPSDYTVKLYNGIKESIEPIYNTYALIEGHVTDEVVVFGNHRDAWVFGAVDPSSGTSVVHDVVKAFGELRKSGWKPFRSILIASWDGEEYGLLGSTEFGEDYAGWIQDHVVAYVNVDSAISGTFANMKASPSLADLVVGCLKDIGPMPSGKHLNVSADSVGDLGSGSDYTVFLQHLGIASAFSEFVRKRTEPVYHYHSIYDSQYWQEDFGDPAFAYHEHLAKWLGLMTLRLADSPLLPINITAYAKTLAKYSHRVHALLKDASLKKEDEKVELHQLDKAVERVQMAASRLANATAESVRCPRRRASMIRKANVAARAFEKGFISKKGLPERPWYKHLGVAPGRWLGYGATSFPGVTEAILIDKDAKSARHEVKRLVRHLKRISRTLRRAAASM